MKKYLMKCPCLIFCMVLLNIQFTLEAQNKPFVSHPSQLEDSSYAEWITPHEETGVFYFRKTFHLAEVPKIFVVHVSADARYRLYVNGNLASWGPATGDIENWNYETVDIALFLKPGINIISSQVWNWGNLNGARQQSVNTAFILQGESPLEHAVNTNKTWKVTRDPGYFALAMNDGTVGGGYIAGATDSVISRYHPHGWKLVEFNDSEWDDAKEAGKGNHTGLDTWKGTAWKLKERELPPMMQKDERTLTILELKGVSNPDHNTLHLLIPSNSRAEILLDNHVLTMGFPQIHLAGGKDSKIIVQYQESLFHENGTKGNRDEWKGKIMKGYYDVFIPDGRDLIFETLWIRVFRYIKIVIETGDQPLQIVDLFNRYTAYPLQQKATFGSDDAALKQIWDVSWRTQQLCALETFMDCPYYEQLQYIGDTRIQALITLYVTGEERLAKNAIHQIYNSMQSMGLTKSVHPTSGVQIIPPFSLLYIGMIYDYYMLRNDPVFVRQFIPGIKFILEWFISRIGEDGIMGPLPYWNHIDGGTDFINGSPPGISDGGSANMTVLLAYALEKASILLRDFGFDCEADRYLEISVKLKEKTMELCFTKDRGLIAETPAKLEYSQHTNIFAVLIGMFDSTESKEIMQKIITDSSLIQTTLYFKFYLFQALKQTGMGDHVLSLMNNWEVFLDNGFSTFPEHGINSRSDCHAWSAHPMYHLLNTVLGIGPSSAGFQTIEIVPAIGNLKELKGTMPHPLGEISVHYKTTKNDILECEVVLPVGLSGSLKYQDNSFLLHEGTNDLTIKAKK